MALSCWVLLEQLGLLRQVSPRGLFWPSGSSGIELRRSETTTKKNGDVSGHEVVAVLLDELLAHAA